MKRLPRVLSTLAACGLFACAAQAQQGPAGFVLGVAGGISKFNDSCEGVTRCDTTDRAIRANLGYGLGNGLVIEAVSFNFGKFKAVDGGIAIEIGATAVGGGVAYYAPVSSHGALFFRLGAAQVKAKVTGTGFGGSFSDSDSQTTAYAGIGYAWTLGENVAVELAWESTQLKYADAKESVSGATVGLSLRF